MAAPAFALTPPTTYPALPLDRLMAWQRQVFANTNLRPSRKTVAAALATYHNSQTGWTFPSLRTIARVTGHHVETVIESYRDLEAEGHLQHIERFRADTRGRDSHQYTLKLRGEVPANGNAHPPAEVVGEVLGSAEHPCSDPPSTPCSAQPNVTTESLNDKTERADDAAVPTQETAPESAPPPAPPAPPSLAAAAPIRDSRLERLAQRVQRLGLAARQCPQHRPPGRQPLRH
jgi:DNA-binding transcriptional MocR family regulator